MKEPMAPTSDAHDRAHQKAAAFLKQVRKAMKKGEMSTEPDLELEQREAQSRMSDGRQKDSRRVVQEAMDEGDGNDDNDTDEERLGGDHSNDDSDEEDQTGQDDHSNNDESEDEDEGDDDDQDQRNAITANAVRSQHENAQASSSIATDDFFAL